MMQLLMYNTKYSCENCHIIESMLNTKTKLSLILVSLKNVTLKQLKYDICLFVFIQLIFTSLFILIRQSAMSHFQGFTMKILRKKSVNNEQ